MEPKLDPSGWNDYDYIIFVANLPTRTRKDCGPCGTGWRGKKPPRASLPWCWQSPVRSRTWTASYAGQLSRSSSSTQIKARNMPTKNFWRSILWLLVKWEYQLCRIASYFPKAHLTAWQFTWDSCFPPQQFWAPERLRSKRAAFVISRTLQSETFNLQFWCIYTTQAPCAIHQVLTDSGCDKFKGPLPVVQTICCGNMPDFCFIYPLVYQRLNPRFWAPIQLGQTPWVVVQVQQAVMEAHHRWAFQVDLVNVR